MILYGEDRITPAKRTALALAELIQTRYPKDALHVVLFGDDAWEVPLSDLPYVGVGPFHTNTRAGLQLAQEILRKKRQANRQIFMLTDGKPSALTERGGRIYKNPFGLDRRVVSKTLDEAANCRRRGIPITTFMLTQDPMLVDFVERLTRINRGRAYYSQPDRVGDFVFVDYLRNRRRRVR
jgi:Ca-activated chloride channel homolog